MTVDSNGTTARERLSLNFGTLLAQSNALITKPEARVALVETKDKEETALLARSFATREATLKQELTSLRQSKKESAKRLSSWRQKSCPCESGSLSWKRQLRHPKPRWRGLKKGP